MRTVASDKTTSDLLAKDCAFFNIFVADLYQAMLANPNKQIDLLFFTVPQKYFTLILLVLAKVVLPYDWISIVAILVVGTTLHWARAKQILNPCVNAFERLVGCGLACNPATIGYITAA